ncbi:DUF5994 family protein [Streptomyces sp. NPDC006290]|uniref:DUF5994 family protein n=1 Tax=Streptomyces sp. NPDC006290 TaxID=3156745 RepID=UPI0033BB2993
MSATADHLPPRVALFKAPTVRLALKPVSPSRGRVELDGAWWPRSHDLAHELSALADVLDPLWGRITRIAVDPGHWPIIPRRIFVNAQVVKVDWFTAGQDQHKILLLSYKAGRWDLLVIPPETSAPAAARLMAAASSGTGPALTATALLAAEQVDATPLACESDTDRPARLPLGGWQPSSPARPAVR